MGRGVITQLDDICYQIKFSVSHAPKWDTENPADPNSAEPFPGSHYPGTLHSQTNPI